MQAHDLARQALDLSRDIENEWGVGIAQRALGRIALARRKVTDAARHLHEALDTFDAVHARYDAARTHLDLATLASTQGEPESAATHLSTAYAWFKQLQVPKWVEKTEQRAHEYGISLTDVTLRRMPDGKSHIC